MKKEETLSNNYIFFKTLELISSKRKKFTGLLIPYQMLRNTSLETVDLPIRAYHCLKRTGCHTIGDVLEKYPTKDLLKRIRNCGNKSANDIFIYFMAYQYEIMSEEERGNYLKRLLEVNGMS